MDCGFSESDSDIEGEIMSILVIVICLFGWLGEALKDGANIK